MPSQQFIPFRSLFENRRALVVGGTGFLGNAVIERLLSLGAHVTSFSARRRHPRAENILCDWTDAAAVRAALQDTAFDYVFNCGGYLNPSRTIGVEQEIFANHFHGVHNLCAALPWPTVRCFFHCGSGEEYGRAPAPQKETQVCEPTSPYGVVKLTATHAVAMRVAQGLPVVIGRAFLAYGSDAREGLCHHVFTRAIANQEIPLSPGEQTRDFIHIDDLCAGIFTVVQAVCEQRIAPGNIVNIGTGQGTTVRKFVETVCQIAGGGRPIFGALPYRDGETMEAYADTTRLRALGWTQKISLSDGIKEVLQVMRQVDN